MKKQEVIGLLKSEGQELEALYKQADKIRADNFGGEVFLRGIIEFSNYCRKNCFYCGIRRSNLGVKRYRISDDEIVEAARKAEKAHCNTVVLQSGEDLFYTKDKMGELIKRIKQETHLTITLSVGERDLATYEYWKKCGMDRYLLRFETSNQKLFKACHPDDDFHQRIECLKNLKDLGVQTGSGFLIGLPNETYEDLAEDILFCTRLNLDMIGVGPFIVHTNTPFHVSHNPFPKEVFFKTIAILRVLNPKAHIPATTAFDAIDPNGRNLLLQRGANVFMPNMTPKKYRKLYMLYPGKPCVDESADDCANCTFRRISSIGRKVEN